MPNLTNIFGIINENNIDLIKSRLLDESKERKLIDLDLTIDIKNESIKRISIDKELNLEFDKNIEERRKENKILIDKINNLNERLNYIRDSQHKLENGFIFIENNIWYNVKNKYKIEVLGITRSNPPTRIMLRYGNCEIIYKIIKSIKSLRCCYYYNGYYYLPEDKYLLRYSTTGIITEDYIICRITIINKNNNVNLTIENKKLFNIRKLENNFQLWKKRNIKNYSFDFRWLCYCTPNFTRPVNINVKENKIDSVLYLDTRETVIDTSYLKTFDQLFDYLKESFKNDASDIQVSYDNNFNFITDNYIDYIKQAIDDERGFKVENFKILYKHPELNNGFIIRENNYWYNVKHKYQIKVIGITKSLPPTKIKLEYNNCLEPIYYEIVRDQSYKNNCYYYYNGYYYLPEKKSIRLLRYSPSGIVTMDYIKCRITIIGEYVKNNLQLKIEK